LPPDHTILRLQLIAVAGEGKTAILVGHGHHRLQPAQIAVHAPILRQLHARTFELVGKTLELGLKPFQKRKCVGGGAGKAGDHAAAADPPHLARIALDDGLAERHLPVAGHRDLARVADAEDGSPVPAHGVVAGRMNCLHCRRR
jgi:hypothetical protein